MIEFDELGKRMVPKLVYYGPALSGKTTNLLQLHDLLAKRGRGDLMVHDTKDDRGRFFSACKESDLMARAGGMKTLLDDGSEKVRGGETTLEELLRVIGPQTKPERTCEGCGKGVDSRFAFCPYCSMAKSNFCGKCMIVLDEDWPVCPSCGMPKGGVR